MTKTSHQAVTACIIYQGSDMYTVHALATVPLRALGVLAGRVLWCDTDACRRVLGGGMLTTVSW